VAQLECHILLELKIVDVGHRLLERMKAMSEPDPSFHAFCPQCSATVDEDAKFCKYCAFDLSKPAIDRGTSVALLGRSPERGKRLMVAIGVTVVAVLVFAIIGTYVYRKNRTQASFVAPPSSPTIGDKAKQIEDKILRNEALTESDVAGLSEYELRVLRNVHFARYGRKYDQGGQLGEYFYTCAWYKPSDAYNESNITATDKANINVILSAEKILNESKTIVSNSTSTSGTVESTPTPQKTNELNRDTVLALVRGRYSNKVKVSMSTSSYTLRNLTDLYTQMIKAKVISCQSGNAQWNNCMPAAKGHGLYISEQPGGSVAGSLSLDIGYKVPSAVSGISRIDDASAYADVVFVFEPSNVYGLYSQWSTVFYRPPNTQNEQHRFLLRRYDDGWRVERSLN
jgi:hypothetical protein